MGRIETLRGELDTAIKELVRAIAINANFAHAFYCPGWAQVLAGRAAEASDRKDSALRLNPNDPALCTLIGSKAFALQLLGRLQEHADWAKRVTHSGVTGLWGHAIEAVVLAQVSKDKADFTAAFVRKTLPFREGRRLALVMQGLSKAGFVGVEGTKSSCSADPTPPTSKVPSDSVHLPLPLRRRPGQSITTCVDL